MSKAELKPHELMQKVADFLERESVPYRIVGAMASIRDIGSMLAIQGEKIDHIYLDKWASELGVVEELAAAGAVDEGVCLPAKGHGQRASDQVEPPFSAILQIAEESKDHGHRWNNDKDVVPDKTATVQHAWRYGEQEHGSDGPSSAEPVAQGPDQQNCSHGKERCAHASGGIGDANQEIDKRGQVIQKRAVIHRVMAITLTGDKLPRFPGMRALVVAVCSVAQVPQPG